jgi:hypothetical protein
VNELVRFKLRAHIVLHNAPSLISASLLLVRRGLFETDYLIWVHPHTAFYLLLQHHGAVAFRWCK